MADPRVFLSFDFDHDETSKTLFAGQGKQNSPTPYTLADWSSKATLPEPQWEAIVKSKINQCHLMIVLVGKNMATASGVVKEIAMAKSQNVPSFGVYVNGAGSTTTLPAGLARNRVITWTWPGVSAAITQMLGEGKNKN
jgi:hypothetical protein